MHVDHLFLEDFKVVVVNAVLEFECSIRHSTLALQHRDSLIQDLFKRHGLPSGGGVVPQGSSTAADLTSAVAQ